MNSSMNLIAAQRIRRALSAATVSVFILFAGLAQATTPPIAPASGYWWNPNQTGNGFVIEIQNDQLFMAGFLYASSGVKSGSATSENRFDTSRCFA